MMNRLCLVMTLRLLLNLCGFVLRYYSNPWCMFWSSKKGVLNNRERLSTSALLGVCITEEAIAGKALRVLHEKLAENYYIDMTI